VPQGALAFQWSTQARYMTDLRLGYLQGCLLVANRAWDRLAHAQRQGVLAAAAKGGMRLEELGRETDQQLMNGLFARQGMKVSAPSQALRLQYFEAARAAREQLSDQVVPRALIDKIMRMLADYRAERH
jgi:TRAP-type C4-dicarboxylate transport system substrate-binding protein